jgi:hypothetical protein
MSAVKRCHTGFPMLEQNVQSKTANHVQEAAAQALIASIVGYRGGLGGVWPFLGGYEKVGGSALLW